MTISARALPGQLEHLAGRIIDVDSHEMMPLQQWESVFGPDAAPLAQAWRANGVTIDEDINHPNVPDFAGDVAEIDDQIMRVKGSRAPGAVSPERRLEVMDVMGIERQLMFPGSIGLYGTTLLMNAHDPEFFPTITSDRAGIARRCIARYQDWLVDFAGVSDRIRPVAPIAEETVPEVIDTTRRLIERGIRAIWLPAGLPVGGVSPAHSSLDPLWAMCAEADCTVTLHIGGEGQVLASTAWNQAEAFEGFRSLGEFSVDPYSLSTVHLSFQNFVTAVVLGGVFVRHPRLRFGVIETGAHWVGPLMEVMDLWHGSMGHFNTNPNRLPELPSTYVKSNVRVSFFPFEPADVYLDRHDLGDVLCFATDYPHIEGGKDIYKTLTGKLDRFGPAFTRRFYRDNGSWLLPD